MIYQSWKKFWNFQTPKLKHACMTEANMLFNAPKSIYNRPKLKTFQVFLSLKYLQAFNKKAFTFLWSSLLTAQAFSFKLSYLFYKLSEMIVKLIYGDPEFINSLLWEHVQLFATLERGRIYLKTFTDTLGKNPESESWKDNTNPINNEFQFLPINLLRNYYNLNLNNIG